MGHTWRSKINVGVRSWALLLWALSISESTGNGIPISFLLPVPAKGRAAGRHDTVSVGSLMGSVRS